MSAAVTGEPTRATLENRELLGADRPDWDRSEAVVREPETVQREVDHLSASLEVLEREIEALEAKLGYVLHPLSRPREISKLVDEPVAPLIDHLRGIRLRVDAAIVNVRDILERAQVEGR